MRFMECCGTVGKMDAEANQASGVSTFLSKVDCANVLFVFVSFVLNVDDSGTRDDSVVVEQKVKETIFERG